MDEYDYTKRYNVNDNGKTDLDIVKIKRIQLELDTVIKEINKTKLYYDQDYADRTNERIINIINQSIEAVMHKDKYGNYILHEICLIRHLDKVVLHLIDIFPQAVHEMSSRSEYPIDR